MPATLSQSTRVKPRNSQRSARSATRQGLVTLAMRRARPSSRGSREVTLNLPGTRDRSHSKYSEQKNRRCSVQCLPLLSRVVCCGSHGKTRA